MEILEESRLVRALHLAFDFSWTQWLALGPRIKSGELNPFSTTIFRPWRTLESLAPKSLEEAFSIVEKTKIVALTPLNPNYPKALLDQAHIPSVVYLLGQEIPDARSLVAIVGTRMPSRFGVEVAPIIARVVAEAGLGIASGLARGIDTLAHRSSLEKGAYNLAILGSGMERLYPKENQNLVQEIIQAGGTVISQFPPQAAPHPTHFPRRNKLLAALTAGTFVVEGSRASGALITGRNSLELGRSVVVFTQDFRSDFGKGAIELILAGAHPSSGVEEGLEAIARPWGGKLSALRERAPIPAKESFDAFLARTGLDCRMALIAYKSVGKRPA